MIEKLKNKVSSLEIELEYKRKRDAEEEEKKWKKREDEDDVSFPCWAFIVSYVVAYLHFLHSIFATNSWTLRVFSFFRYYTKPE